MLRKTLLPILLVFLAFQLQGQITLYGLQGSSEIDPEDPISNIQPLNLVSVDPYTADITPLFGIDGSFAVGAGASTFDHHSQTFIYWGPDNTQTYRIYSVIVSDSSTISTPATDDRPIELEFDLESGLTYGLNYDQSTQTNSLVTVSLADGAATDVATLPFLDGIAIGNSTYDSNGKRYIFIGVDNSGNFRLYTISSLDGTILSDPIIDNSQGRIGGIEYDNKNDILYGVYTVEDQSMMDSFNLMYYNRMYFAEIDMQTAQGTPVSDTPILEGYTVGYQVGGIAYDQATQTYILRGTGNAGFRLLTVQAVTGSIISDVPLPQNFGEMQVDNNSFAREFYDLTSNNEIEETLGISLFPNPTSDVLSVKNEEGFSANTSLEIYDASGRLVQSSSFVPEGQVTFDVQVNTLPQGNYTLSISVAGNIKKSLGFIRL